MWEGGSPHVSVVVNNQVQYQISVVEDPFSYISCVGIGGGGGGGGGGKQQGPRLCNRPFLLGIRDVATDNTGVTPKLKRNLKAPLSAF